MPQDDLDAWFRSHPRLRRYQRIYESHQSGGARQAQRSSWLALAVLAVALWIMTSLQAGSWWAPIELLKARLAPPPAPSAPIPVPDEAGGSE
ncbi:MAG: hypothetical protein VKO21_02355 [Candidatus Sericytochromatia bacterium]|nr:hypothetical protein [Candidatus Sericytochromatia bacterium]